MTILAAQWLNLVVPGGGVVAVGRTTRGMTVGLLFAAAANGAVAGTLLFPDDVPRWVQQGLITAAVLSYAAAQLMFVRGARALSRRAADRERRSALQCAVEALRAGDADVAIAALAPLAHLADADLLVAYRLAQAHELLADDQRREAWERVARLDPHGIYRDEVRRFLRETQEHRTPSL